MADKRPARMRSVADRNARELSASIDKRVAELRGLYAELAPRADGPNVWDELAVRLLRLIQEARTDATVQASHHLRRELRVISRQASGVPLGKQASVNPLEIQGYVGNAIADAQRIVAASEVAKDVAFAEAYAHGELVLDTEYVKAYQEQRRADFLALAHAPDDDSLGFRVARDANDRSSSKKPLVLLLEQWNATNDKRTCEWCSARNGETHLLLEGGLGTDRPPAHPRCRCVMSLWAVGWPIETADRSLNAMPTNDLEHTSDGAMLRYCLPEMPQAEGLPIERRVASVDRMSRTVRVIASTESVDSYGTILRADGWMLDRYMRNPIVLFGHDSHTLENVMGRAIDVAVKGKRLEITIKFADEGTNERADLAFDYFEQDILKGVSVGFIPYEYEDVQMRGVDGETRTIRCFTRMELVELSVAPVPANPDALARALHAHTDACNSCKPKETRDMTSENAIPEALREALGETVEAALAKLAEYNLTQDNLRRDLDALRAEHSSVVATLETRAKAERESEVDGLIAAGAIKSEKRDDALRLLSAAPESFRALYPREISTVAPMAHLLREQVPSEGSARVSSVVRPAESTTPEERMSALVAEYRSKGMSLGDAVNKAFSMATTPTAQI